VGVSIALAFLGVTMLALMTTWEISFEAATLARQRSQELPTCAWVIKDGQSYSCFLSHYKAEAGAEARYIKE
jgi:hypothetical protein